MRIAFRHVLLAALLLSGASCSRQPEASTEAPTSTPAAGASAATPATPATVPAAATDAAADASQQAVFGPEELEQMLAPIALYPDSLLSQVLMASTYPGEVADAVAWSAAHKDAKGDAAVKQVADQPWDPSVQALVAFPDALVTLGQDPAWVQRMGDAFLAQPDDVMDTVQRLRAKAKAAGNLQSNKYQTVTEEPAPPPPSGGDVQVVEAPASTIVVQPADPQVVYVPSYNPTTVYGTWSYPAYPPVYYPPPPGYYAGRALVNGLAFGTGIAITNALWGGFDWGHHDVHVDVNRYNNINVNRHLDVNQSSWRHDGAHRGGVPYRDSASRQRYGNRVGGADHRQAFRGDTPQRARSREQARASMQKHGVAAPARTNAQARSSARAAANSPQMRNRAAAGRVGAAAGSRPGAGHNVASRGNGRTAASQRAHSSQHNAQARQRARQSTSRAAPKNNAFAGARHPSATRAQAQRGHSSQAAARRPSSVRSGRPVSRPAPSRGHAAPHAAPHRSSGGRRHR